VNYGSPNRPVARLWVRYDGQCRVGPGKNVELPVELVASSGLQVVWSIAAFDVLFSFKNRTRGIVIINYVNSLEEQIIMLRRALIFLVVAIIAEIFGFSGAAGEAAWIAHVLFVIAIIFLIISFFTGRRGPPVA
jgi:uncharacterized membrane protein YtjA (UPF0391 family)